MKTVMKERRQHARRSCRGQVIVQRMSNGRRVLGELIDIGRGGVRLALSHGLMEDEFVRLFFPARAEKIRPEGRLIIGHVVESKAEVGRHIVRLAFGWDAALGMGRRPLRGDSRTQAVYRPWSAKVRALVATVWRRG